MKKMCHCGTYLSLYIIKRDTHYVRLHFPVILIVFYPASRNKTSASLEQLQFLWEHLLPSSGHETVLMTYRTVEVIQLLGRNSTCHLSSALSSHPLPAHWLWLIILFTICPPSTLCLPLSFPPSASSFLTMIAFTMSFLLCFSARTALARDTLAWAITSSMSLCSRPPSSTWCIERKKEARIKRDFRTYVLTVVEIGIQKQ